MNRNDANGLVCSVLLKVVGAMVWLCVLVWITLVGVPSVWADAAVKGPGSEALVAQVHEYLDASDAYSEDLRLADILNRDDVTVASVSEAIRHPPTLLREPVSFLPEQTIRVDGREFRYSLHVPETYHPSRPMPLVVCLHGAGFTGETYIQRWAPRLQGRFIVLCPTVRGGMWWRRSSEELVLRAIEATRRRYHVDSERIFLTGMSNGAIGAWLIGMHYADRFAGIAPMAGGLDEVLFPFVQNLQYTPVYVIHGAHDRVMPVRLSRDLVVEMERLGIAFVYREHDRTHPHAGGHFFPREELPALVRWFDGQRRQAVPRQVTVVRDATHLARLSWVRIDATERIAAFSDELMDREDALIAEKVYARMDARVVDGNRIRVTTDRVKRYTLFLHENLVDLSRPITVETNGARSFRGHVKASVETLLREARRGQDRVRLFPATLTIDVP